VVHVDCDAHELVHPVPQVVVHALVWHWNVTLLGGAASPPSLPPRTQAPPEQVQTLPSHWHPTPVHVAAPFASLPASVGPVAASLASVPASGVGGGFVGAASLPESPVSITSLLSLPQPTSIAAAIIAAEPTKYIR
jgi:hypothetical protein